MFKVKINPWYWIQNRFAGTSPTSIKELNYEQLKKYINHNDTLIIDVRTKKELAETGILPNSHNIPRMFDIKFIINYLL